MTPRVAVLVPCRNEAVAVGRVVADLKVALPGATVYVYDNGSTDETAAIARAAGAVVRHEPVPGKGGVVRRMFADVEADVYVMIDGDATYEAARAPAMVAMLVEQGLDMVTGVREHEDTAAYRRMHASGNRAFNLILGTLFGQRPTDMLSGFRALSRRFVKSFPSESQGFEIETEMTVHAMELRVPTGELATRYVARPEGSASKLATWRDGLRILRFMVHLFRDVKPLDFFVVLAGLLFVAGLSVGAGVIQEYMTTRLVPRLPSAVLATGLMVLAAVSLASGFVLDSVARGRREAKRLAYLAVPAPFAETRAPTSARQAPAVLLDAGR